MPFISVQPAGASGYSGYSGRSGYSGYSGVSGVSGFSGYSGTSGFSGYSGISGYSGQTPAAVSGFSGYSGISGFSGYSGQVGPTGPTGSSGFSGYSGTPGTNGATGVSGYSGYSGPSGFSGYSGISGYSGYSGISGYGKGSGNTLIVCTALNVEPTATAGAQLDQIAGGSTPAENKYVLNFDASTDEFADFYVRMPSRYNGGGITIKFFISGVIANAGATTCEIGAAIRRLTDNSENITASQTYDYNYASVTTNATANIPKEFSISFTSGADMDSWAAGEWAIIRFTRDADGTNGTDSFGSDMSLWGFEVQET